MKIRPLHDRIVVRRLAEEEKTAGGIIIPDTAKEKPLEAEVVAVGPGKLLDNGNRKEVEIKPGERVLIGKYSGTDVQVGEDDLVIIREDEVLGVVI